MKFGNLVLSETRPLTKALVAEHMALEPAPVERPFNQKRHDYLTSKLTEGLFVPPHWVAGRVNGKLQRMNGQHSGRVLADWTGDFPEGLFVHYDEYDLNSEGHFAMLFRQFDARQSSRSPTDVCAAYKGLEPALSGVAVGAAKGLIEGYCWYERSVEGLPVGTGDDRYEKLANERAQAFVLWAHKLWSPKAKEVQKPGVVASMLGTFEKEEADADKFWDEVVRDINPDETAASSRLAAELQKAHRTDNDVKFKPGEYYAKCVKAWNAFRRGVSVRDLRVDLKKELPEIE